MLVVDILQTQVLSTVMVVVVQGGRRAGGRLTATLAYPCMSCSRPTNGKLMSILLILLQTDSSPSMSLAQLSKVL